MEFGNPSVVIDGGLGAPVVWLAIVVAAAALTLALAVIAWVAGRAVRRPMSQGTIAVATAAVAIWLSPAVFERTASLLATIGAPQRVGICLVPTRLLARDYAPGVIAVAFAAVVWCWASFGQQRHAGRVQPHEPVA